MIRTTKLNRCIVLERKVETKNRNGAIVTTWEKYKDTLAYMQPERGRFSYDGERAVAFGIVVWEVMYDANITTKMRVVYDGNYYDIKWKRPEGHKESLWLYTELVEN